MRKFNLLEIIINLDERKASSEENRVIRGKNLEGFMLRKIKQVTKFCTSIFSAKATAFWGSLAIIALSLSIQSSRDIGHDSAVYIEIAQKILAGGKYYHDFFELNFPLNFWLTLIPISLAKILSISPIFTTVIFVNLLGILSIFWASKIIQRKNLEPKNILNNLIILSFALAFFLRPLTLNFNEFFTKSSYFLILAFPYFSYHILESKKRSDEFATGVLAGLIFCLKANYGILVIVFELAKLFKNRDLKRSFNLAFCLRNYMVLVVLALYSLAIFFFQKDFFENFSAISQTYFQDIQSISPAIIREDIFPLILILSLSLLLLKEKILHKFYLLSTAAALIVCSELIGGLDQRFIIHSLSSATVVLSAFFLVKNGFFDFKKHGILLLAILLVSQFDAKNTFNLALDICYFWFVFIVVFRFKKSDHKIKSHFLHLRDFYSWIRFVALAAAVIFLSYNSKTAFLSWFVSAIIFIYAVVFYQKNYSKNRLSLMSSLVVVLVVAYFISGYLSAITGLGGYSQESYRYKSPSYVNEEMIKISNKYSAASDEVIIISYMIPPSYPTFIYMNKQNQLPHSQMFNSFLRISSKNQKLSDGEKYLFLRFKRQLESENNKLIFVEVGNYNYHKCRIGFLEYYFRDAEFRRIFLKNYRFLNRIIATKNTEKEMSFYKDDLVPEGQMQDAKDIRTIRDIEVYVRR